MPSADDAFEQYRNNLRRNYMQLLLLATQQPPLPSPAAPAGLPAIGGQNNLEQRRLMTAPRADVAPPANH